MRSHLRGLDGYAEQAKALTPPAVQRKITPGAPPRKDETAAAPPEAAAPEGAAPESAAPEGAAPEAAAPEAADITISLDEVAAPAPPPDSGARPLEVIANSGAADVSGGQIYDRIVAMMHQNPNMRFVEAARQVARSNSIATRPGDSGTVTGAPSPLPSFPSVRYALVLANNNYHGAWADLDDVRQRGAAGSGVNRALERDYGRGNTEVVRNRTAVQLTAAIRAAIHTVAGRLHAGENGELLVNFMGHGGPEGLAGVDGQMLDLATLQLLGDEAMAVCVDLVLVTDGCNQGTSVVAAQRSAMRTLATRVDNTAMPPERADQLRAELAQIDELTLALTDFMRYANQFQGYGDEPSADRLYWMVDGYTKLRGVMQTIPAEHRTAGWPILSALGNQRFVELVQAVEETDPPAHGGHGATQFARHMYRLFRTNLDALCDEVASVEQGIDIAIAVQGL